MAYKTVLLTGSSRLSYTILVYRSVVLVVAVEAFDFTVERKLLVKFSLKARWFVIRACHLHLRFQCV